MQKFIHYTVVGYMALLVLIKMLAMPAACFEYAVNKEYIAATLCENKAKPQMHCNGQCHLKKELAKTSDTSTDQKGGVKLASVDYCEELKGIVFLSPADIESAYNRTPCVFYISGYKGDVFHPPVV